MLRYNRTQFIFIQLLIMAAFTTALIITKVFKLPPNIVITMLFTLIFSTSTATLVGITKRIRDIGYSGYWVIGVFLISLSGRFLSDSAMGWLDTAIVIFFALIPGNKSENKYGLPSTHRCVLW